MKLKIIFIIALVLFLSGCASLPFFGNKGFNYSGPLDLSDVYGYLNSASDCMGLSRVDTNGLKITLDVVPNNKHGFIDPWGFKVGGYCQQMGQKSYHIKVMNDPTFILHEFGHVVGYLNHKTGHPPEYKHCFYNWFTAKASILLLNDEKRTICFQDLTSTNSCDTVQEK